MSASGLSVVTVCMNRREHLLHSSAQLALWPHHQEHLIVDWSSAEPLRREDLPGDRRLRLLRVEGEDRWNLCRAYNFAIARARGSQLLKLDADCWPSEHFDPAAPGLRVAIEASDSVLGNDGQPILCALGSGAEGRKGQFLMARALLAAVGGYNEVLVGYGFDDKDLAARLVQRLRVEPARIPADWLAVIPTPIRNGPSRHRPQASSDCGAPRGSPPCGPPVWPTGCWLPSSPGDGVREPPATWRRPRGYGGWSLAASHSPPRRCRMRSSTPGA